MTRRANILDDVRRLYKKAAAAGFVLALICHLVPPEYRAACHAIASVCTGEFP